MTEPKSLTEAALSAEPTMSTEPESLTEAALSAEPTMSTEPAPSAVHRASAGAMPSAEPKPLLGAPGAQLVIISGPSGVGKDTIITALQERDPDYHYVVTCTTRAPRPGEVQDVSYHFLTMDEFAELRDAGELLESAEVHGNWYGTPRHEVADALAEGHDVILKIDVQGASAVKQRASGALLVFLVPPSMEELFQRLRTRATETADELEIRQRNAAIELARQGDYDRVVVNETDQQARTAAEIEAIITQEKRRSADRRVRIT